MVERPFRTGCGLGCGLAIGWILAQAAIGLAILGLLVALIVGLTRGLREDRQAASPPKIPAGRDLAARESGEQQDALAWIGVVALQLAGGGPGLAYAALPSAAFPSAAGPASGDAGFGPASKPLGGTVRTESTDRPDMRLEWVKVGPLRYRANLREGTYLGKVPYCQVMVSVTNRSQTGLLHYRGSQSNPFHSHASLRDDLGNYYKPMDFSLSIQKPIGPLGDESVHPGQRAEDLYIFEAPVAAARMLTLRIDGEAIGAAGPMVLTADLAPDEPIRKEPVAVKATPKPAPQWRVWKSASGKFEVEAEFVSRTGNVVKLGTKDGQTVTIAVDRLSEEDQKWLSGRVRP